MPYAQAGEIRLYYESFGRGVPFLFVSGTGWPGEPWKLKQVPAFIDRYQVIVYDHRGAGKSDAPAGYYSTREFAQEAANLLDALGINEPAHIIGHSMGGRVCQWLAIDYPRKMRSMIQAASGSGSMGNPDYPRWLTVDSLKSMIEKGYKEHMLSHFKSRFFFPPEFVKAHPEVLEILFKSFWETGPSSIPIYAMSSPATSMRPVSYSTRLMRPTLVLVDGEDKADADTGNHVITSKHLRDNIYNAEFAVVEGCGHGFSGTSRSRLTRSSGIGSTGTNLLAPPCDSVVRNERMRVSDQEEALLALLQQDTGTGEIIFIFSVAPIPLRTRTMLD